MSEDSALAYSADRAIELAKLWRAGKMIGGDEDGVIYALLDEIERLRAEVDRLRAAAVPEGFSSPLVINALKSGSRMLSRWAELYGLMDSKAVLPPSGHVDTLELIDDAIAMLAAAPQPPTVEPKA